MSSRRVPTRHQVRRAQDMDDAPAAAWAWTCQVLAWCLVPLVALGMPQRVLMVATGVVLMAVGGGFLGLALRAHRLAYDRRRAFDPAASWWEMAE